MKTGDCLGGGRIREIDGISGILALVIVIYHYGHFSPFLEGNPYPFNRMLAIVYQYGYLCVDFFFILSGFVIEYSYGERISKITFRDFIIKRIRRLYPLYLLTTLVVGGLQLVYYSYEQAFFCHPISLWGLVLHIFGLQNAGFSELTFNGPAWYVGILVLMYILYFGGQRYLKSSITVMIGILLGACIVCLNCGYPLINYNVGRGVVGFFIGVLLCRFNAIYQVNLHVVFGTLFLMSALMVIFGASIIGNVVLFYAIVFWPLLLLFFLHNQWMTALLRTPIFLFLGKISYDVFLWHFPLEIVFVLIWKTGWIPEFHLYSRRFFIFRIAIVLIIASVSHFCFEEKLRLLLSGVVKKCVKRKEANREELISDQDYTER